MSLRDELQRPQLKALLIAGGLFVLLAVVVYFYSKNKNGALASSNPNGLNADASGPVPTVLVLPPPIIHLEPPATPGDTPASQPPVMPGATGPTGILSQPPLPLPGGAPYPPLPYRTGPTGIHA